MATEKRLIDANALKSAMYLITHVCNTETIFIDAIIDEIDNADDVDAVEVVHGRWIPIIDEPTPLRNFAMISGYECSICGRYEDEEEPYCNCGAKMDGERKDNDL